MKKLLVLSVLLYSSYALAFKVVLDPGHGGKFSGPVGYSEQLIGKECNLDITLRLGTFLEEKGVEVHYTRKDDTNLKDELADDLLARVAVARDLQADLFVSIHTNGSSDSSKRGYEVYVPMIAEFPFEAYVAAACIHHVFSQNREVEWGGALGNLNHFDRGVKAAKFNVFVHNPCPAVLVLADFCSNEDQELNLLKPEYRQMIAELIGQGILNYIKLQECDEPF